MLQIWHSLKYLNIYGVILIIFDQKISHRSTHPSFTSPAAELHYQIMLKTIFWYGLTYIKKNI